MFRQFSEGPASSSQRQTLIRWKWLRVSGLSLAQQSKNHFEKRPRWSKVSLMVSHCACGIFVYNHFDWMFQICCSWWVFTLRKPLQCIHVANILQCVSLMYNGMFSRFDSDNFKVPFIFSVAKIYLKIMKFRRAFQAYMF